MSKYIPKAVQIKDDFYAVKETGWIPVNREGKVLGEGGRIVAGEERPDRENRYLRYKNWPIHRIVAMTFLPADDDPDKLVVNHKDGIKFHNHVDNLEWCTHSENSVHAYQTGLRPDNTNIHVKDIRTGEVTTFQTLQECARHFNVNGGTIFYYLRGRRKKPFRNYYDLRRCNQEFVGFNKDDIIDLDERGSFVYIFVVPEDKSLKPILFSSLRQIPAYLKKTQGVKISEGGISWYLKGKGKNPKGPHFYSGFHFYYLKEYLKKFPNKNTNNELLNNCERHEDVERSWDNRFGSRVPRQLKVIDLESGNNEIYNGLEEYISIHCPGTLKNSLEKRIWNNGYILDGKRFVYIYD